MLILGWAKLHWIDLTNMKNKQSNNLKFLQINLDKCLLKRSVFLYSELLRLIDLSWVFLELFSLQRKLDFWVPEKNELKRY